MYTEIILFQDVLTKIILFQEVLTKIILFQEVYSKISIGNSNWNKLSAPESELYPWDLASTYIKNPPFFQGRHLKDTSGNFRILWFWCSSRYFWNTQ